MGTADRPAIDHGVLSPSGRVSKAARLLALERERVRLFGPDGLSKAKIPQPTEAETLMRQAAELRALADRGMRPRAHAARAAALEARAAELGACE